MNWFRFLPALLLCACVSDSRRAAVPPAPASYLAYIGTYTGPKSKGIYAFRSPGGETAEPLGLVAETASPSFLTIDPKGPFLFAANELPQVEGKPTGLVTAFSVDRSSGKLTEINHQLSGGAGPCHVEVDRRGQTLLVANYGGGTVGAFPVHSDGSLGLATSVNKHRGSSADRQRQNAPHAHCVVLDPQNHFAYAADLGIDRILIYKFNPKLGLIDSSVAADVWMTPGSGPRHLAFHPTGRFLYSINELSSTLTSFAVNPKNGSLHARNTVSTLPADFTGNNSTAEVEVHPSGRFVYGSNRGHNSIAVFAIDPKSGKARLIQNQPCGGKTPRNFAIHPSGRFLWAANQDSNNIAIFRIDPQTGRLTATDTTLEVGTPVCIRFLAENAQPGK